MSHAGGCPNCHRPLAARETLCVSCGYSRSTGAVVDTVARRPSLADHALHASTRFCFHPLILGPILAAAAVGLALLCRNNTEAAGAYSITTVLVCIIATIVQAKYWWCDSTNTNAAEIAVFGWIAAVFSDDAPPVLRVLTIVAATMATSTILLQLNTIAAAGTPESIAPTP